MNRGGIEIGEYQIKPRDGRSARVLEPPEIAKVVETYEMGNSIKVTARVHGMSRTLVGRLLHEQKANIRQKGHQSKAEGACHDSP